MRGVYTVTVNVVPGPFRPSYSDTYWVSLLEQILCRCKIIQIILCPPSVDIYFLIPVKGRKEFAFQMD